MASACNAAYYQNYEVLGLPYSGTEKQGRLVAVTCTYVIGTATYSSGTVDSTSGVVKLFKHRAGWKLIGGWISSGAVVNTGPQIGDGTTVNKYMATTDLSAGAVGALAAGAYGYQPTTDVDVTLTWGGTGTPAPGISLNVFFLFVQN